MNGGCIKHVGTIATHQCRECGHGFCDDCVVYPFGPKKSPMCIKCAMSFAGVNARGGRAPARAPKMSWAERRRRKQQTGNQPALIT